MYPHIIGPVGTMRPNADLGLAGGNPGGRLLQMLLPAADALLSHQKVGLPLVQQRPFLSVEGTGTPNKKKVYLFISGTQKLGNKLVPCGKAQWKMHPRHNTKKTKVKN